MKDLSIWAQLWIVVTAAVLGSAGAFLLALVIAVLLRWGTPANTPQPVVLVVTGRVARFLRAKLRPTAARIAPRSAGEQTSGEAALSGSVAATQTMP